MRFLTIFLLSISSVLASEVAVIETMKTSEIQVVLTDEQLIQNFEKYFFTNTCKARLNYNNSLKEFYFPQSCRANVTKFFLDNGYKPDQLTRVFIK